MKRFLISGAALLALSLAELSAAEFTSRLANVTRPWIGPEYWSSPMMDWQLNGGQMECTVSGPRHEVHLLTHELSRRDGSFRAGARLGHLEPDAPGERPVFAGFHLAVTGGTEDHRSALFNNRGLHVGLTSAGHLVVGGETKEQAFDPALIRDLTLVVNATTKGNRTVFRLAVYPADQVEGAAAGVFETELRRQTMHGNVALACHPLERGGDARFWFRDWTVSGDKVDAAPERTFGPVLWSQYTLHRRVMKMTAHLAPVGESESRVATLHLDADGRWEKIAQSTIDPLARTAHFRVEHWDDTRDHSYRVTYELTTAEGPQTKHWEGIVRRDPRDKDQITLAALSCMVDFAFPNQYVAADVAAQDPDILFFAGDQLYENVAGYGVVRTRSADDVPRAMLNYLPKYWLFGWSFRDVLKDRPAVIIMDDHDVYHGNIWGQGGAPMSPDAPNTGSYGGYNMHPLWVNAVQRTQVSHLPDPVDPAPVKQGIDVYFTDFRYGGLSLAILEDRKFKSAPADALEQPVPPSQRIDHIHEGSNYDVRQLDRPGLELLGERQEVFLRQWAQDWQGVDFKAVLSQSPFCNVATTHGRERARLEADLDSNGWPQTARNRALDLVRRAHALMIHGDQHLASLVQHGIEAWGDAGWAYTCPGLANGYPRTWQPDSPGRNRRSGMPEYTGDFLDGFKNRITVWAAANRLDMLEPGIQPKNVLERLQVNGSGYGIIRFNKAGLTTTIESWPVHGNWKPGADLPQHPGWPRTVSMDDQYGREAAAWLPKVVVAGGPPRPAIQIVDEATGKVVYTRRMPGAEWRPKVFADGLYTVVVGEVGGPEVVRRIGTATVPKASEATITFQLP